MARKTCESLLSFLHVIPLSMEFLHIFLCVKSTFRDNVMYSCAFKGYVKSYLDLQQTNQTYQFCWQSVFFIIIFVDVFSIHLKNVLWVFSVIEKYDILTFPVVKLSSRDHMFRCWEVCYQFVDSSGSHFFDFYNAVSIGAKTLDNSGVRELSAKINCFSSKKLVHKTKCLSVDSPRN